MGILLCDSSGNIGNGEEEGCGCRLNCLKLCWLVGACVSLCNSETVQLCRISLWWGLRQLSWFSPVDYRGGSSQLSSSRLLKQFKGSLRYSGPRGCSGNTLGVLYYRTPIGYRGHLKNTLGVTSWLQEGGRRRHFSSSFGISSKPCLGHLCFNNQVQL